MTSVTLAMTKDRHSVPELNSGPESVTSDCGIRRNDERDARDDGAKTLAMTGR
jgi:hypothetical protein